MEQIGIERLTGLLAFARTAALGSYTAAAKVLGVSPSAVSKSVQRLEDSLRLKLFSRTTRTLSLTPEGQELFEKALRLIANVEEIEQAALAARTEPVGVLKVTAPLPIGTYILAAALPKFRERYPKIIVDLRLGDQFADIIQEGIDVAIRVGRLSDSRLRAKYLAPHRLCAFASPTYLKKRGVPQHPDELHKHDCVNYRYQSSGQPLNWPFTIGSKVMELAIKPSLIVDVSGAVLEAVAAGGGVGMAPTYVAAPFLRRGDLVPVLPQFATDRTRITALWPESRKSSPNVKAFLHFLSEVFPEPTPWD
jgi:DNA-binding transcriptional LysR family regulator